LRSSGQRADLPEQPNPVPVAPALSKPLLLVEPIDRDPADLDTLVRCRYSHQGAFVGAGGGPPSGHRRALGILALDLDMQIWDHGPERFDELARRVETTLARLRGGIVIVVLGREQFIDDRQVAPIPAPVVELTDGRLQLVAHLADPVGRQKATVTDGSRQHSRRRAPSPFPTSRPTREDPLALRRGPEGPRRSSRLEAASRPSRRKIPAHNVAFKTCPAHFLPLAIAD